MLFLDWIRCFLRSLSALTDNVPEGRSGRRPCSVKLPHLKETVLSYIEENRNSLEKRRGVRNDVIAVKTLLYPDKCHN